MNADAPHQGASRPGGVLLQESVTRRILRAYFDVYNELGFGFLESVYSAALGILLREAGLQVRSEAPIDVRFRGALVGSFRADYLVEESVIVELKAVRHLDDVHMAQLANYLRASHIEIGLLLNFGPKAEFRRMVMQEARHRIRVDPRESAVPPPSHGTKRS